MDPRLLEDARRIAMRKEWRLQLLLPSILAWDEPFALRITLFDAYDLPCGDLPMRLTFEPIEGLRGLPREVELDASNGGILTLPDLCLAGGDALRITAQADSACGSFPVASNVAWAYATPPYRLFWGDLHIHTAFSNCQAWACKDPEFSLQYASEAAGLDFVAFADHSHGIECFSGGEGDRWARTQELLRQHDAPGRFVPFLGFESSHSTENGGDNNVYFLDLDAPHFWPDPSSRPNVPLETLWAWLDQTGKRYFTASHHTGRRGKYRKWSTDRYDPAREPVLEIYSAWGSSERNPSRHPVAGGVNPDACYFVDALRAGCRFGVIASSDDHTSMPGGMSQNWSAPFAPTAMDGYPHKGLAAIRADSLTRESLWAGIFQRTCYATTWRRTLLDVSVGSVPMGQAVEVDAGDPLRKRRTIRATFDFSVAGDAWVTVMRNGATWKQQLFDWNDPRALVQTVAFEDDEPLDAIAIRDAHFHPDPFVVYYVRVEDAEGQTVWSSPIWLDIV